MKQLFCIAIGMFVVLSSNAQSEIDAIRYSQTTFGGTARSYSMGGAIGAVGSDISSLNVNPAGLGLSRSQEFTISMGFFNNKTTAEYFNGSFDESKFNLNIPNIGYKYTWINRSMGQEVKEGWSSFSIGFNVNRRNEYNSRSFYSGVNKSNSMTDYFTEQTNASPTHPNDYTQSEPIQYLAYNSYLVDYDNVNDQFFSSIAFPTTNVTQTGTIERRGSANDYNAAFAANYSNKLYLGLGFNVTSVRHKYESNFQEQDNEGDTGLDFNYLNFTEKINTKGYGVGLRLGAIFKPTKYLRLGASLESPVKLKFKDEYGYTLDSRFDLGAVDPYTNNPKQPTHLSINDLEYTYFVTTPMKLTGSAAYQFKKKGMVSADIEMVDYTSVNMDAEDYDFLPENARIKSLYRQAVNYRVGGELNFGPYKVRAGYAYYASPFKDSEVAFNEDLARKSLTFGLGVADNEYSFDVALVRTKWAEYSQPYSLESQETAFVTHNHKSMNLVVTLALKIK
jgi:hypothetical protein